MSAEWRDEAACRDTDPDVFFPERGHSTSPAKAICASCAHRQECLDFALDEGMRYGVWGGLSTQERRGLYTRRLASIAECGTDSGYYRHRRNGEDACESCKTAHSIATNDREHRRRGTAA